MDSGKYKLTHQTNVRKLNLNYNSKAVELTISSCPELFQSRTSAAHGSGTLPYADCGECCLLHVAPCSFSLSTQCLDQALPILLVFLEKLQQN